MDKTINSSKGTTFVLITAMDKKRINQRWTKALIVKVYGKTAGYSFLKKNAWNMEAYKNLIIINLGKDFFLIDFKQIENYIKAAHGDTL